LLLIGRLFIYLIRQHPILRETFARQFVPQLR
jgi:hypothetical protein